MLMKSTLKYRFPVLFYIAFGVHRLLFVVLKTSLLLTIIEKGFLCFPKFFSKNLLRHIHEDI